MATTDIFHISGGLKPNRKSIKFIGGDVDDYIEQNAFTVARKAAADTTGTFSVWVNVPDITGTYCIWCAGDNDVVEFFEIAIEAGKFALRITDATTAQVVTVTDNVVIKQHEWVKLAVVQDGVSPKMYVNGELVASTNSTDTNTAQWWDGLDGLNTSNIGAANKTGDAARTNEFKGAISDFKYWDLALTADQIELEYNDSLPASIDATYLQLHYKWNDDYVDSGLGEDNGTNTGGGIILINGYSEFTSRLAFMTGTPVVADTVKCFASDGIGHAIVIQAA